MLFVFDQNHEGPRSTRGMSDGPPTGNRNEQQTTATLDSPNESDDSEAPFLETLDSLVNDIEDHDVSKWPLVENLSLLVFTILQVFSPILVRLAHKQATQNGQSFLGSTTVFMTEVAKVLCCCVIIPLHQRSLPKLFSLIWESFTVNIVETLKVATPAFIYVVQNNLYYFALKRVNASLFALTYQLRILTTALLMMLILGRRFTRLQWLALILSLVGAIAVQMGSTFSTDSSRQQDETIGSEQLVGLSAVLIMCLTNAFGGVYLEAVLKKSSDDIFLQNIRLSMISLPMAALTMGSDWETIKTHGFFAGWNVYVCVLVTSAAFGGVVVSAVIKYADNIRKSFSQALALGGTAFVSVLMGDSVFSVFLLIGVLLVVMSVVLYTTAPPYHKKGQIMKYDQRRLDVNSAGYTPVSTHPTDKP